MKVNGKQVDILQWLHDTGGSSAIKRFTSQQAQAQNQKAATSKTLSKEDAANLRNQLAYGKAAMTPGAEANAISSYLSNLKNLQTAPAAATQNTNSVQLNTTNKNNATVKGSYNSVEFATQNAEAHGNTITVNGEGNIIRGYNGGQADNTMTVTGNTNRVLAAENASANNLTVNGSHNTVNLAAEASNNAVAVTGSNVKVTIGSQGSNQNWNINVAASNVEVTVTNGAASVNLPQELKDKYKVSIDNTAKTVSVTAV